MACSVDLDPRAILCETEDAVMVQREAAVEELRLALRWADLHSGDPREQPDAHPEGDRLVRLGGEGTPRAQELCWAELAVARRAGVVATRHLAADALDLRHRLPRVWAVVQGLVLPAWVARKVAATSRKLTLEQVGLVDTAIAAAAEQPPSRILEISEAKVIEADLDAHRRRVAEEAAKVGVHLSRPRTGDQVDDPRQGPGTRRVSMRLQQGAALEFDALVSEVARRLAENEPDGPLTVDQWRAEAVRLIANPHAAAALLDETDTEQPARRRTSATVHVHLDADVLTGTQLGLARVEGIGPMLLDQLAELLARRDIGLLPVIDLRERRSVNGYEHPTTMKARTFLRTLGDVFPHSGITTRGLDHDHAIPWPRGQTSDLNDAPLARRHHRAKTHLGYTLRQLDISAYRWTTPHGLGRLVTPTGTREFEPLGTTGELYRQ